MIGGGHEQTGCQAAFIDVQNANPTDPASIDCRGSANVGIKGSSSTNFGIHGISTTSAGVFAESELSGQGLLAKAITGNAVQADSDSGVGVAGTTNSSSQSAVFGFNGAKGQVPDGLNRPAGSGVWGHTTVEKGSGVVGSVDGNLTQAAGVVGIGPIAARFFGDVEVTGKINGGDCQFNTITALVDVKLSGGDCAEDFDVSDGEQIEPGTVMVVGTEGRLHRSHQAYDKRVAGVISGAGDLEPGIVLDKQRLQLNRKPIALLGKVYCKVDAGYGEVEVGDLLTTSPTLGHVMKAEDPSKAFGAVIGKALRPLGSGQGLIPILIALQ